MRTGVLIFVLLDSPGLRVKTRHGSRGGDREKFTEDTVPENSADWPIAGYYDQVGMATPWRLRGYS